MAKQFTVDKQSGWHWKEQPDSYGRRATLIGTCRNCGHPVRAVATRAVLSLSMSANVLRGKVMEWRSRAKPHTIRRRPWTVDDLPFTATCTCGQHDGAGCGAVYSGVDHLEVR